MSTEPEQTNKTELQMLKDRAALMGLTHSNNISVETLRAKIEAKVNGEPDTSESGTDGNGTDSSATQVNAFDAAAALAEERDTILTATKPIPERKLSLAEQLQRDELKLVRLRISNLDPKKKDLPGEVITVANEYLGTVRKFIPFGEFTDEGFHVPHILYTFLKERKFLHISVVKDRRTGTNRTQQRWVKEFSLEVLPALTPEEIKRLATAQIAAGSFDHEEI